MVRKLGHRLPTAVASIAQAVGQCLNKWFVTFPDRTIRF